MRMIQRGKRINNGLLVALILIVLPLSRSFELKVNCFRSPATTRRWRSTTSHDRLKKLPLAPFSVKNNNKRPFRRESSLSISSLPYLPLPTPVSPSVSALLALILSTLVGYRSETLVPNIGILVTLVSAAILSNLKLAPISHPLYDLCWTVFLPASLALLLLSSCGTTERTNTTDSSSSWNDSQVLATIQTVAIPFIIGSIGSIVGCVVAAGICCRWPSLWSPSNAILAASCLCASYIGGSVNFFATANIISSHHNSNLMTSMAAADLMVMAIYFVFLTAALQSILLNRLFDDIDGGGNSKHSGLTTANESGATNDTIPTSSDVQDVQHEPSSRLQSTLATLFVASLSLVIVHVANRVERTLARNMSLPGTACAVIALLTTAVSQLLSRNNALWKRMQQVAALLSQICFQQLFASIGMSANIGSALRNGPACLWLSMTALIFHVAIVLGGSLTCKVAFFPKIQLQHVLVASNAAIGGPATAAAFCGQIGQERRAKGLTIAATVWGVIGYAIGTGIGVSLFRILATVGEFVP